ncbi:site-specific DNA-methyltransferase [Azonexus hydrophilus]|uniref:site-specific DNA-methyltransferase (adenine-specific) n=1 Tax=Azonexus hydrophilus TaxID=418702 RepID=A0A1R1IDN1_9RHOO|nr:site-specific DNA-methyltransferase [Azonexus hydrophilus]
MKKIEANSPEAQSADIMADNLAQLRALFPELITEGTSGPAINVDVLKALVGDQIVTDADEKYGLNWHGKKKARQIALTPSIGTLRPCPDESVDWETTQNLMIEGDNLEVLKLLQKSYAGKVKLIYIDPPYNTGNDFVYPDNFQDNIKNYLELTRQTEGGTKITSNTEASGRFHTDWLNMMYPRLKAARNLLREDGVIFITIDDGEASTLRFLCDEIFGEENFRACASWQKKYAVSNNFKGIASIRDYVLIYSKSESFDNGLLPRDDDSLARYQNPDNDPRGPWKPVDYWNMASVEDRPNLVYPIRNPNTGLEINPDRKAWKFSKETHDKHESEGRIWWGLQGTNAVPALKLFLADVRDGLIPHNWWPHVDVGHTDEAKKALDRLFDGVAPFDTPKPLRLLTRIFQVGALGSDDLVLDFFAGSGTTGQAVYEANKKDGGNRRFILVQIPERTNNENYPTISRITAERLRRAGKAIKFEHPMFTGDVGFRVFQLDTSNIRAWNPKVGDMKAALFDHLEHLESNRSSDDILYEILLKLGLDLCVPIEKREIVGKQVNSVGAGVLMACLVENIKAAEVEALALGIVAWREEQGTVGDTTAVFRDSAFENDVAKSNLAAILEQHGIKQVRSL